MVSRMRLSFPVSRARCFLAFAAIATLLAACGGGGGGSAGLPPANTTPPVASDPALEVGNSLQVSTLLRAVPSNADGGGTASGGGATDATSLTIHYQRPDGDYTNWKLHAFGAGVDPGWTTGYSSVRTDAFGGIYEVPLKTPTGNVGYIFHKGDTKDHSDADQSWTLKPGANEIWRKSGDLTTYTSLAAATGGAVTAPDIKTLRVHYQRYTDDYANWGLHLWDTNGIDTTRMPSGVTLGVWPQAVPFDKMPGYRKSAAEVVFDIPVLNPSLDAKRTQLAFVIHGQSPNQDDKDGRANDIVVKYDTLKITNQVAEVWLVQQDATLYSAAPDLRTSSLSEARGIWLNKQLIRWPRVNTSGVIKLYHSSTGQIKARKDEKVSGADGFIALDAFTGTVPAAVASRFKWVGNGATLSVKTADLPQMGALHKKQLVLVQEDAAGNVQNATMTQTAGALDDLYAAAASVNDLGVTISAGNTSFKLWAPTAQKVSVFTYDTPTGNAVSVDTMNFNPTTGVWSASKAGDLSGKYYRFSTEVFVRGQGIVRNLVTDPYSIGLTANSLRSYIASLDAANLKPSGWDGLPLPSKVSSATDMSIYELHVRDFSVNDPTVSAANRGKYLAFTESASNGMKHLKALSEAGLTDVHLLPAFDLATVPEGTCTTPSISNGLASDDLGQQALVSAMRETDCFNWGYDPFHFTAPEGSYASDATDGARRILEFRQMVKGLNDLGLRVGLDVVYNHTTASGQNTKSVLDRVVPGYYHRLNESGAVIRDSCCDDTASENLMMGKLMIDSAIVWARDYKISSFRFDLMGFHPRAVMKELKAQVKAVTGRDVQLFGEGWNFGVVANAARFEQAAQGTMPGDGIGTFGDKLRDRVRGGGCCDSGVNLVKAQGYVNGAHYDRNERNVADGSGIDLGNLMWQGDMIKGALAGSIRDYTLTTSWNASLPLSDSNGLQGVGYATQPDEVVNYVENHDNQTLFDNNAMKLPQATSKADRARVQILGAATVAFAQGIAYYHAGVDTLRSKSLDRNSYNSGDWFNRLDWTYTDNFFGTGMPFESDAGTQALMRPFLTNTGIKPTANDIAWTRDAFRDLLKVRYSSTLFRMKSAEDIKARLKFHNTGSAMVPTVIVGQLIGTSPTAYPGANFKEVVYLINVDKVAQNVTVDPLKGKGYVLHPVQAAGSDPVVKTATYDNASGKFSIPARTAAVFVLN